MCIRDSLETKSLKHMDIPDTLVKGMCTADIMIKGTAAVQVMVDPVKTGFFEHFCLVLCEKAYGAAEMSSVFFHFADPAGQLLDLFICKFHTTQSDTMSG